MSQPNTPCTAPRIRHIVAAISLIVTAAILIFISSCEMAANGGDQSGDPTPAPDPTPPPPTASPAQALTDSIAFSGGSVKSGQPPAPTGNPGDPQLSGAPTYAVTMSPGHQGNMTIDYTNVAADADFEVNIRFGDTDSYISVPINRTRSAALFPQSAHDTSGSVSLPFTIPDNVCDALSAQRQRIACCESISVGGVQVSVEQARELVLNCEQDSKIFYGYCLYNFATRPDTISEAIALVQSYLDDLWDGNTFGPNGETLYVRYDWTPGPGIGACGTAFSSPNSTTIFAADVAQSTSEWLPVLGALSVTVSDSPPPEPILVQCRAGD